jgi:hypothetical protein
LVVVMVSVDEVPVVAPGLNTPVVPAGSPLTPRLIEAVQLVRAMLIV